MKTIVYVTTNEEKAKRFCEHMSNSGVHVTQNRPDEDVSKYRDALFMTDSASFYERYKDVLIVIESPEEIENYPHARYFVMEPECAELDYFEKIYCRIHDLPWTIAVTDRLILRETVESDVDVFFELYQDPEMTRYTEKLYENPELEKEYVREYREKVYAMQGFGIWTVIRKSDNAIIGRAGLTVREGFAGVELGFAIGTKYQRCGYATEAIKECIHLSKEMELFPCYALCDHGNVASLRVLEKCGFIFGESVQIDKHNYARITLPQSKWI